MRALTLFNPLTAGPTTPFIVAIVLLLGLTLWSAVRAKRRYQELEARGIVEDLLTAGSQVDTLARDLEGVDTRLVNAAPGVLLVLGLLGTFVGIALTIQSASSLLHTHSADVQAIDQQLLGMSQTLADMGSKFQSSVWGIVAHLAARILRDFDVARARRQVEDKVSELQVRERVRRDQQLREILEGVRGVLVDNLPLLGKIDQGAKNIGQGSEKLAETLGHVAALVKDFRATAESLKTTSSYMKDVFDNAKGAQSVAAELVDNNRKERREMLEHLRELMVAEERLRSAHAQAWSAGAESLSREVRDGAGQIAERIAKETQDSSGRLSQVVRDDLRTTLTEFQQRVVDSVGQIARMYGEAQRSVPPPPTTRADRPGR